MVYLHVIKPELPESVEMDFGATTDEVRHHHKRKSGHITGIADSAKLNQLADNEANQTKILRFILTQLCTLINPMLLEDKSFKDSKKKKRRDSSKLHASQDTEGFEEPKRSDLEIRGELLKLVKEATDSEIKIFTTVAVEVKEEDDGLTDEVVQAAHAHSDYPNLTSYPSVMCELVKMFVKLRRFPKFIAKLLSCFRGYILSENQYKGTPSLEELFSVDLFLPPEFIEEIRDVICSLPVGQMIDLFKSLYHNLYEECIKPICENSALESSRVLFLKIITELFCEFLRNVKVVDHTVSAPTMEKVSEIMKKIRDESLTLLGNFVVRNTTDVRLVSSFLKLCHDWGELHGFLLNFKNDMYKFDLENSFSTVLSDESPVNLTFFHSYVTSENWQLLLTHVESLGDVHCSSELARLVVQKLKYLTILGKATSHGGTTVNDLQQRLQKHLQLTTAYLLTHHHQLSCQLSLEHLYQLTSQYLDDTQIIDLIRNVVKHGSAAENENLIENSSLNRKFEAFLTLETIEFIFHRLAKMKVLAKCYRKTISHEIFSIENKMALVSQSKQNIFDAFLQIVNELIEKSNLQEAVDAENEHETIADLLADELILEKLNFLNQMNLEDYPTHLRTMVVLSSITILLITSSCPDKSNPLMIVIITILRQGASHSKGNQTLFGISWTKLYLWLYSHVGHFSPELLRNFLLVILQNIYVSAKSIDEFEKECASLHEELTMASPTTTIRLITLEFLLKVLPASIQAKSKLTPKLRNHIINLTHLVVKALKKSSSTKPQNLTSTKEDSVFFLSNIFRSCWLAQLALPTLAETENDSNNEAVSMNDNEINISRLKRISCKHINLALELLNEKSCDDDDNEIANIAKPYAINFLHTVCKSRKELDERFPENFIHQLWCICMNMNEEIWTNCAKMSSAENSKLLPKDMFEMATPEEFAELKTLMLTEMTKLIRKKNQEVKLAKLGAFIHILDCLLEASIKNSEEKDNRREILDGTLCSMMQLSLTWNSSNVCLKKLVLPILQFQTKLLRRRNAICNPNPAATCLSSITTVPLADIIDLKLYGEIFCAAAELLNAFTVHRLDVLSFRMHIYLQCFQFLIENLASKANQDNKLGDEEIFHLKSCSHQIERTCQSMKLNQKQFSRVSPYFVAILMRQFEMFAVYPAVKDPLLSGCYKLLDLCDSHGVAQLNSMLTVGSRETFKSVYELYNKFYKYKGKV